MKQDYRDYFKECSKYIKFPLILAEVGVTPANFSHFMNGADSVMSEDKLNAVYNETQKVLQKLESIQISIDSFKGVKMKGLEQIYNECFKGFDGITLDLKKKEMRSKGGTNIYQRKNSYDVGFRNSGVSQNTLNYLVAEYGVQIRYDNTSQLITLNVSGCIPINEKGISNPTRGYFMMKDLSDEDAVKVFKFIKDNE